MRICLICRKRNIDHYGICPDCRKFSDQMLTLSADLSGMTAVVTGGRIKIGYAACLRLLRQGARVIAVTRYPRSAWENFSREPDFQDFSPRLSVIGFDLIRIDRIPELVRCIADISGGQVDILVNNAAQTVKKSKDYYSAALAHESALAIECGAVYPLVSPEGSGSSFGIIPQYSLVDYGETDLDNSWVRKPEEISPQEMLEVQLINVSAPFLLTNSLRQFMGNDPERRKFVINVSSVEGRFWNKPKLARHVHTNMAKASLNMMTHSISSDFARDGIYVYSCDPGWVSNQFPPGYEISRDFTPYLTYEDGAARILYPIVKNITADKVTDFGAFYKDYNIIEY